jgi:glycerate dehydrogenase
MRIVILDGKTANPGDLSWQGLEALGDCDIYERTPVDEVADRCRDAEIVITNKAIVSRQVIESCPSIKYIGVTATGFNIVDVEAAREKGIVVTNVPSYSTNSVAQTVFAHLLAHTHHAEGHTRSVRAGEWSNCPDFSYQIHPAAEIAHGTLGIVGLGTIGRAVAKIALGFEMNVIAHNHRPKDPPEGVKMVDLETLLAESDVISLHCPLTPETEGLINARRLAMMKPTAILINTSRGPLLDEAAVAEALNSGQIAGAGVDVLSAEPPAADHPLLSAQNCTITPHLAWASRAARERLLAVTIANVEAFLAGTPQNVVS